MGDGRLAQGYKMETAPQPNSSTFLVEREDYRRFSNIVKPCTGDGNLLPFLTISESGKSGKTYDSAVGRVSIDENGAVTIDKNCQQLFSYAPSEKETFVWSGGKNAATLSEVKLSNGGFLEFNSMSNRWLAYDSTGKFSGEQHYHYASMKVCGLTITLPLEGPITPERLQGEYQKLQTAFVDGKIDGVIPFDDGQFAANLASLRNNEGLETKAYKDSKGIWTIGHGLNLEAPEAKELLAAAGVDYSSLMARKETDCPYELSKEQSEKLLQLTTLRAVYDCRLAYPGFDNYAPGVKDVLLDLMFNMGPETLKTFTRFNALVKGGNNKAAAEMLLASDYARQVGDRALRNAAKLKRE